MLWLFVYGSLKPGECNYHQVAGWVQQVRPAWTGGQLYMRADGYPALWLPTVQRLGAGSRDYVTDALRCGPTQEPGPERRVSGMLLGLHTPLRCLPELDRFEGYSPGLTSDYYRELILAHTEQGLLRVWAYLCADPQVDWQVIEQWPVPRQGPPRARY